MDVLAVASTAFAALVVAALLVRLLRRRRLPPHLQQATCPACGWEGTVSRYAGRCPACNAPVGERRARRGPPMAP